MVTLELPEVVVYGFHVVPEVVQALQHQTTFITSLRLLLLLKLQCAVVEIENFVRIGKSANFETGPWT